MINQTQHTFSDNIINFHLPKGWTELNREQLLYVALVLSMFPSTQLKTYVFARFTGITVHRKNTRGWLCSIRYKWRKSIPFILADWQVQSFIHQLDWLDTPPSVPVRPSRIGNYIAIDAQLHGLVFKDYLITENLYQGYLYTKDVNYLRQMVPYLFRDGRPWWKKIPQRWRDGDLMCIFIWWMGVKNYFARVFPDFFSPADSSSTTDTPDFVQQMNVQIRALTGGDVTKETLVMQMDCWRALTELNAKAHDVKELKRRQHE